MKITHESKEDKDILKEIQIQILDSVASELTIELCNYIQTPKISVV